MASAAPFAPSKEAPPILVALRPDGTTFRATPVCRRCVEKHEIPAGQLHPFPEEHRCEVKACDGKSSFLFIY